MGPNFTKAKMRANDILEKYNVTNPPVPIIDIVKGEGLNISTVSLSDFRTSDNPVCGALLVEDRTIAVEKTDSHVRQRFTLAHELGHWLLHPGEIEKHPELAVAMAFRAPVGGETSPLEQEANCFAATLLVPERMLKYWHERTQDQYHLARIFAVSPELMGYRLKNAGLVI